jgi:hypothetical protein
MVEPQTCLEIRELLPEVAAGVADGNARALALAHSVRCADCRRELDEITAVMDALVLLAPEREPLAGFESAVLTALAPAPLQRRPGRAVALAVAAAILVAAVSGGLVWRQTGDDRQLARQYRDTLAVAGGRYLTAADVKTVGGHPAGHVFAYQGEPSWVFVSIDAAPSSGRYWVQLITTDQRTINIGYCNVTAGKGSWGATVPVAIHDIGRIQLSRAGSPSMSARFH